MKTIKLQHIAAAVAAAAVAAAGAFGVHRIGAAPNGQQVSNYSVPTQIESEVATTSTLTSLTCPAFRIAPRNGWTIIATLGIGTGNTLSTPPTGFTAVPNGARQSTTTAAKAYYKVAASEANVGYTFSRASPAANFTLTCEEWAGTSTTTPIGVSTNAVATNVTSYALPAIAPNEPGDLAVEDAVEGDAGVTQTTDPLLTTIAWTATVGSLSTTEMVAPKPTNKWLKTVAGTPTFNASATSSAAFIFFLRPVQTAYVAVVPTYAPATAPPGVPTPTPTAAPTATPTPGGAPALPHVWVYADGTNGDNKTTTLAEMNQYLDWCEGLSNAQYNSSSAFTIDQCPGGGFTYFSLTMMEPHTSGGLAPQPWGGAFANGSAGGGAGTCPSPWNASNPFAATTGTYLPDLSSTGSGNWLNYAHGASIGANGSAITGYAGSDYRFFPNLNSASMQTAINQIVQNCAYGLSGTKIIAFDLLKGDMSDNTHGGPQSQHAGLYDGHTSAQYGQGLNWAGGVSVAPTPAGCTSPCYASSTGIGTPATYFAGGNPHTQGAYINSNCGSAAGDLTCDTATYPGDNDYTAAESSALAAIKHRDGSQFYSVPNGMYNGYDACTIGASAGVLASEKEFATQGPSENGVPQADNVMRQLVNVASQNYACTGKPIVTLDYLNSSQYNSQGAGTSAPGAAAYEMQMRLHFGMLWALTPDAYPQMMASMIQGCLESCAYSEWTDTYGADLANVSGQVETYFAKAIATGGGQCGENYYFYNFTGSPCASGGIYDTNDTVSTTGGACTAGSNACVVRRIYAHAYFWNAAACPTRDRRNWLSCNHDVGPLAVLINLTGSTITLSTNFLSAALGSYWAQMHYVIEPGCQPLAGMYGNTAGSPLYPADGLEGTASTTIQCTAGTYLDLHNGSAPGGYALTNLTAIGTSTGPTLHDTGAVILAAGTP